MNTIREEKDQYNYEKKMNKGSTAFGNYIDQRKLKERIGKIELESFSEVQILD